MSSQRGLVLALWFHLKTYASLAAWFCQWIHLLVLLISPKKAARAISLPFVSLLRFDHFIENLPCLLSLMIVVIYLPLVLTYLYHLWPNSTLMIYLCSCAAGLVCLLLWCAGILERTVMQAQVSFVPSRNLHPDRYGFWLDPLFPLQTLKLDPDLLSEFGTG